MVGLALEGGGAKGAYQVGAYMALKKCHVKVNAVCGTSIGSFNGALIASHEEKKMLALWKDATMSSLLGIDDTKAMQILKGNINLDNIKWSLSELYKIFKNKGLDMSNYRAMVRNNVDENKLRKSNIKYGLTTVKLDNLEPLEVYLDDMPTGTLHDYIIASSYLPIFKKEKLVDDNYYIDGGFYNLCPTDMLERIGCTKIYTINIKGIGIRKNNPLSKAEIIEIKPNNNLGSIIIFDKKSNEDNIKYGYNDVLKVFNKLDGYRYYFKKKSDNYYKKLNKKVSVNLKNATSALLNTKDDKEMVLKALEYVLESEKYNDLKIYKVKEVTRILKNNNSDNIIYRYVKSL